MVAFLLDNPVLDLNNSNCSDSHASWNKHLKKVNPFCIPLMIPKMQPYVSQSSRKIFGLKKLCFVRSVYAKDSLSVENA